MIFSAPFRLNAKHLLFVFFGVMFSYVLVHKESFLVNTADPVWKHYEPFKWWLLAHGLAGACALFLSPLQFSDRLRQHPIGLHRVVGRIYVASVFIAGPLGIYIQFFNERLGGARSVSIAAGSHGVLWMLTTAVALAFILQRKTQQHRQWMTRSFAVGPGVFVVVRVILGISGWERLGPAAIETAVWVCLVFAVFFADIALQWQDLWGRRSSVNKARAVGNLSLPQQGALRT